METIKQAREQSSTPPVADPARPGRPPMLESEQLFRGHRTIEISHNGSLYRLQATRQGKLILTK